MRFRVDTRWGSISYDESEENYARDHYEREGYRLTWCDGLQDEGVIVAGIPAYIPVTGRWSPQ